MKMKKDLTTELRMNFQEQNKTRKHGEKRGRE